MQVPKVGSYAGGPGRLARLGVLAATVGLVVGAPAMVALTATASGAATSGTGNPSTTQVAADGFPSEQLITYAPGFDGAVQEAFTDFTTGTSGKIEWSTESSNGSWSAWSEIGTTGASLEETETITWAPGSNGSTQEIFFNTCHYAVVKVAFQTKGVWSTWISMGGDNFYYSIGGPTYAPGSNGSVQELFDVDFTTATYGHGNGGVLYTDYENPGGTWSGWSAALDQTMHFSLNTKVLYSPGTSGSLQELFAYNTTGVYATWENPGGSWHSWVSFSTKTYGYPTTGESLTYAPGSNGSVQQLFLDTHGTLVAKWENPNGTWSAWTPINGDELDSVVTYAPGSNGSTEEIFGVSSTGTAEVTWSVHGAWSAWTSLGKATGTTFGPSVTYAPGSNGSVQELFARGATTPATPYTVTGTVFVAWENPGGSWSGWVPLG